MIDLDFTARFIAGFEGFVGHVYLDAVGVETIGYGETRRDIIERYRQRGMSQEDALELLKQRVQEFADAVERCVTNRAALTPNRHAALTSFAYNVGVGGFAGSTACARLNAGDMAGAVEAMGWWNKGGGRVLEGLSRRRAAEGRLFERDDGPAPSRTPPASGAAGGGSTLLREGDRGDAVWRHQQLLSTCGWAVVADGIFGPATAAAVRSFQGGHGLGDDGIIGPRTSEALASAASTGGPGPHAPSWPGRVLREGVHGDDVRQAQQRLRDRGWAISADGRFGPRTGGVVRTFQAEKGLDADGAIGPRTWASLWAAPVTGGGVTPDATG